MNKVFELTLEERKRICEALDYDLSSIDFRYAEGKPVCDYPEQEERFHQLRALIEKLDPKPVQKHAWMVIYPDESKRGLFDSESEAEGWVAHTPERCKVVKVTWEE